jgi:hypothetical protein
MQRDCPSKRAIIATAEGGYVSASDIEDENIIAANISGSDDGAEEIVCTSATNNYRTLIVHRALSVFNRLPTVGYTQGGKFWVKERRDQELEGARNTKLRQVRAARCVIPYVLYGGLYFLWCRMT